MDCQTSNGHRILWHLFSFFHTICSKWIMCTFCLQCIPGGTSKNYKPEYSTCRMVVTLWIPAISCTMVVLLVAHTFSVTAAFIMCNMYVILPIIGVIATAISAICYHREPKQSDVRQIYIPSKSDTNDQLIPKSNTKFSEKVKMSITENDVDFLKLTKTTRNSSPSILSVILIILSLVTCLPVMLNLSLLDSPLREKFYLYATWCSLLEMFINTVLAFSLLI